MYECDLAPVSPKTLYSVYLHKIYYILYIYIYIYRYYVYEINIGYFTAHLPIAN